MDNIVIAWYKKDEYDKLLNVIDDADSMPVNYGEWLEMYFATTTMKHLRGQGYDVKKVIVNVDELTDWCRVMKKKTLPKTERYL